MLTSIAAVLLIPVAAPSPASAAGCTATAPPQASDNYYELSEPGHIEWIRAASGRWSLAYRMMANIDLASCAQWTSGIGVDSSNAFTGTFDGNGYTIESLNYSGSSSSGTIYSGFFGFLSGARVRDLTLQGSVTASTSASTTYNVKVGLLAGQSSSAATSITNVNVQGTVTATASGMTYAGGVVGECGPGTGTDLESAITVTASGDQNAFAGGICGRSSSSFNMTSVVSSGSVTAPGGNFNRWAGGIAGEADGAVDDATSSVNVTVSGGSPNRVYAGGLFGTSDESITRGYASGDVSTVGGNEVYLGGLVGRSDQVVENSTASGEVRAESVVQLVQVGGLVGESNAAIRDSNARGAVAVATSDASTGTDVGGLVGNTDAAITRAYATGDVSVSGQLSGSLKVGGLGGYVGSTTSDAFASGDVDVTALGTPNMVTVGGLLGQLGGGSLRDAYALGNVTVITGGSGLQAGGLVGDGPGPFTETYAAGAVTATGAGTVFAYGTVSTPTALAKGFCVSTVAAACSRAASPSDQGTIVTTDELQTLELYENDGWSIAADYSQSVTWGICSNFNRGFAYLTALYSSDPCVTSSDSAAPALAEFTFRLPDGRECSLISPAIVEIGSVYSLPDVEALCRATPDSRVHGWTIPVAPGFTGAGSPSLPFNPGHVVDVSGSQQFTVVPWESVLAFRYDSNVAEVDPCEPNNVDHAETDRRSNWVWVPRNDVEKATFPTASSCTPPGYGLIGWNTSGDGTGEVYKPESPLPESWAAESANSRTLYAMWQATAG